MFCFLTFGIFAFGGHFEPFLGPIGLFLGMGKVKKLFWALCIWTNNFCFLSMTLFLFFHVVKNTQNLDLA